MMGLKNNKKLSHLPADASVTCPRRLVILLRRPGAPGLSVPSAAEFQWTVIIPVLFLLPLYATCQPDRLFAFPNTRRKSSYQV